MGRQEAPVVGADDEQKLHAPTHTGPHTPEAKTAIAVSIRAKWEDPVYRNNVITSRATAEKRPDVQKKRIAAANARWADPDQKIQQSTTVAALWQQRDFRLTVLTAKLLRQAGHIEDTFGPGVRLESINFLTLASSNGTWKALEATNRKAVNLIRLYFRTEATIDELAAALHIKPHIVRGIILKGIEFLWQELSPELQEQFPLKTVQRLKITQTPKTKEKMRKSNHTRQAREASGQDEDSDSWEPEKEIWVYAREHELLTLLVIVGFISEKEGEILRRFFEHDNVLGPIEEPSANLLDRFTIGVANLA